MRRAPIAVLAAGAAATLAVTLTPQGATATGWNPSVLVQNTSATEPGIDVAPDGTLYINAPNGVGSKSSIWRSVDGGASWSGTSVLTRTACVGGGDSDISVAPDGRLVWTDLSLASASVGTSTDKGNTWVCQPYSVPVQDRQWVAAVGGDPSISYHATHQLESGIIVSRSVDGGITYPAHFVAATVVDQGNCLCFSGNLVARAGGGPLGTADKLGIAYSFGGTGIRFSRSDNGGLTWTRPFLDNTGGGSTLESFPVLADDGSGTLHAVWLEVNSNNSKVWYSRGANFGATWTTPAAIVTTGTSVFPWIDARGSKVSVALYHTSTGGRPDSVGGNANWFVKYLESTNGGTSWGALDTADTTAAKVGNVCTDGLNCTSGREFGDFLQVVIDPAGKANIAYNRVPVQRQIRTVKQAP